MTNAGCGAQPGCGLCGRWSGRPSARVTGGRIRRGGGQTIIAGLLPDQPALHGVLTKVRDLGLCLISLRRLDTGNAGNEPTR